MCVCVLRIGYVFLIFTHTVCLCVCVILTSGSCPQHFQPALVFFFCFAKAAFTAANDGLSVGCSTDLFKTQKRQGRNRSVLFFNLPALMDGDTEG